MALEDVEAKEVEEKKLAKVGARVKTMLKLYFQILSPTCCHSH